MTNRIRKDIPLPIKTITDERGNDWHLGFVSPQGPRLYNQELTDERKTQFVLAVYTYCPRCGEIAQCGEVLSAIGFLVRCSHCTPPSEANRKYQSAITVGCLSNEKMNELLNNNAKGRNSVWGPENVILNKLMRDGCL